MHKDTGPDQGCQIGAAWSFTVHPPRSVGSQPKSGFTENPINRYPPRQANPVTERSLGRNDGGERCVDEARRNAMSADRKVALFFLGPSSDRRPAASKPVQWTEQQHEVTYVAKQEAGPLGQPHEVAACVAAQMVGDIVVLAPKLGQCRGGDEQQARPAGTSRLAQGP